MHTPPACSITQSSPAPRRPARPSSPRQFAALLLLALGVQALTILGRAQIGERRQLLAAVVAVVLAIVAWCVRPARTLLTHLSNRLVAPCPRKRRWIALLITLFSAVYLYLTATAQHRDFSPILHDEYVYLIQTRTLAGGDLWLPRHELGEFFDSFHLITDHAYAAKYGPGTALLFAPVVLLHLPAWLAPLLLTAAAVGLMYLLATELFDGNAGLLAALMLLSLGIVRRTSIMLMSQAPMLFLALLAMLAYVYWRRERRSGWMLLLGVTVGWGAISRPVDAICIALPLALAVVLDLRQYCYRGRTKFLALGLLGLLPFSLLQLFYNKGVTGHYATLPWSYYAQRYDPYDSLSRKPVDPSLRPRTKILQLLALYDDFTLPAYRDKLSKTRIDLLIDRATRTLTGPPLEEQPVLEGEKNPRRVYGTLPSPLLIALLPVGLLALADRRRWAAWLAIPVFVLIYANYTFFFPHYAVAIAPAVILGVLAGKAAIQQTWPRLAPPAGLSIAAAIIALSLTALPQFNPFRRDQWFDAPLLRNVDRMLAKIDRPAIVLFKYDPERNLHEEPVYNIETARPDQARVIRAHDLGPEEDARLFDYYAEEHPNRVVYRFDEKDNTLTYLGTAMQLHRNPAAAATRPTTTPAPR